MPPALTPSFIPLSVKTSSDGQHCRTVPLSHKNVLSFSSPDFKTLSMPPSMFSLLFPCASNEPHNVTMPPLSRFSLAWHSRWMKKKSSNVPTTAYSMTAQQTWKNRLTTSSTN